MEVEDHEGDDDGEAGPDSCIDVAVEEGEDWEGDTASHHAQPRGQQLEGEAAAASLIGHCTYLLLLLCQCLLLSEIQGIWLFICCHHSPRLTRRT